MTPSPEQIATMSARGWDHNAEMDAFFCRGVDTDGVDTDGSILSMSLCIWNDVGWMADYGTSGVSYGRFRKTHATPELAADEAEAWLRRVLSGLRFPWLVMA